MAFIDKFRKKELCSATEDICESLANLLNTKRSFGALQEGMGLGDYSYAACCDEIIAEIIADIQFNIKNFIPHISQPKIQVVSSQHTLFICFELQCLIQKKEALFHIIYNKKKPIEVTTHCLQKKIK